MTFEMLPASQEFWRRHLSTDHSSFIAPHSISGPAKPGDKLADCASIMFVPSGPHARSCDTPFRNAYCVAVVTE
jgi:hypothetical protein